MDDGTDSADTLRRENRRLAAELEQAHTAAENSQNDVDAALVQMSRLQADLRAREETDRAARVAMERLRSTLGETSASLLAMQTQSARATTAEEEMRVVVEELQVVAEELEASNDALRRSNLELERRVAERTAELAAANAVLSQHNQVLERRIADEVAAREAERSASFRQQKLEALGQLTGGVAHDFNNLLTVVLSGLQLLRRAETAERRDQLLGRIGDAAGRGAALTQRLLALGRRQALHPGPLDLGGRLAELGELLGHSLRGDLRIVTQAESGLWPVQVDHAALELALLNLAVNARDAMPHGGTVTLTAANRPLRGSAAARWDVMPGDYVALAVADTGLGMTPEVQARVFEPFFTTKEHGQGSGLGLAQVYGFAKQSGGGARVESELGEGCTVTLLLPRSLGPPAIAPAADEDAGRAEDAARAAAILVVEDDPEVAALVIDLLTQFGHVPTRVAGVEAALGALGNGRAVDLLFSDVLLPGGGGSGVDLALEVSRRRPELPILLTTGYGGDTVAAAEGIAWPVLHKPYQPEELRAAVDAALASRRPG